MDKYIEGLFALYFSQDISEDDLHVLFSWLEESPENKKMFQELYRAYMNGKQLSLVERLDGNDKWNVLLHKINRKKRVRLRFLQWGAACFFIFGVLFFILFEKGRDSHLEERLASGYLPGSEDVILQTSGNGNIILSKDILLSLADDSGIQILKDGFDLIRNELGEGVLADSLFTIMVPKGGEYYLILSDSTEVWLNSDSKFRFPFHFSKENRKVFIDGEGFFNVRKNEDSPFIVETRGFNVEVLGTKFNISAYEEDESYFATLVSGLLGVSNGKGYTKIYPGQQAVWNKEEDDVIVSNVDVNIYSSWVDGAFEFENMELSEIAKRLSRWYNVEFLFENERVKCRRFTGGFYKYTPLSNILEQMGRTCNIDFEEKDGFVRILNK